MRQRTLSAVFVVLVTVVPAVLGTVSLLALLLVVTVQAARELSRGFSRSLPLSVSSASVTIPAAILLIVTFFTTSGTLLLAVSVLALFLPLAWYARVDDLQRGLRAALTASFAALYLGLPLASALALRSLEGEMTSAWIRALARTAGNEQTALGLAWIGWVISITWLTDTSAYLVGARWGRHKLTPRLSPGKTREGALAGLLTGAVVGALGPSIFGLPFTAWFGALAGTVLAGLAELGDLAESFLKRGLGLKDFGTTIPGHGGVLDRIDALLVTIPATLLLATLLGGGHA